MIQRRRARRGRRPAAPAAIILAAVAAFCPIAAVLAADGWSRWVGHAVDRQPITGAVLGFCCGVVFTLVPVVLAWVVTRGLIRWPVRAAWLVTAALLAAPNVATLGIAAGIGNGAEAARHVLDAAAPMFRGATLTGVGCALLVATALLAANRRRSSLPLHRTA